jgi:DNA processing protein
MAADAHLLDWLALASTPGLGPAGMRLLIECFGGPGQVLAASRAEIERVPGLRRPVLAALGQPPAREAAERELARTRQQGIAILTWDHPAYPALLRNIPDPPLLLFAKGNLDGLGQPGLGVVGARAATSYGRQIAESLSFQLARRGLVIISGFALGIDAAAHRGALRAGGRTVAVLGNGLDMIYPEQNRNLFDKIAETGTLVSEYPLGTKPDAFRFPARNRIISGLSLGVLVVEAAKRSGSLITARQALDQGREVFAVPGRVDSWKSEGTHRLLQEGAKLVFRAEDILEELPPGLTGRPAAKTGAPPLEPLSPEEEQLLALLDVYQQSIDELIQQTGWSAGKVTELLLLLELKQCIESLPGKQYQRKTALSVPR